MAYTHNPVANTLLTQFSGNMDEYVPMGKLFLANDDFIQSVFGKDEDTASVSWIRAMKRKEEGFAYSLFIARLYEMQRERVISALGSQFPGGIPHVSVDDYFLLENAIDWLGDTLSTLPQPFMGYFHFMPPHFPYLTHRDFQDRFVADGFLPVIKPPDVFSKREDNQVEFLLRKRTNYDEYVLYADREFGRLMDGLERSGMLENAWVVLTSDHGEMFERGILGHTTPVLYQPVIRVPLMIFEPGQRSRRDVHGTPARWICCRRSCISPGSSLRTGAKGQYYHPLHPTEPDAERSLYAVQARTNEQYEPLTYATTALIKGQYKLMYFFGYDELGEAGSKRIEMYDLANDPEELNDLYAAKPETAAELLDELKAKLAEVDEPYL